MIKSYLSLPFVEFEDRESLPVTTGVYFIGNDHGALMYVGRSVNLNQRLKSHEKMHVFMRLLRRGVPLRIYYWETPDYVAGEAECIKAFKPLMNREMRVAPRNRHLFEEKSLQIRRLEKEIFALKQENEQLKKGSEQPEQKEKVGGLTLVGTLLHFSTVSALSNPSLYGIAGYCPEESLGIARLLDGFCIIAGDMLLASGISTGTLVAVSGSVASLQQKIQHLLKDRLNNLP